MVLNLLVASSVIMLCIFFNKISNKIGIPVLFAFILLGMIFGVDGIFKISYDNYEFSEQICSIALIFIMFYGGFGTNWNEAKPVAFKSMLLSTFGVVLTALLTGLFCYFVLGFNLIEGFLIGSVISSTDAASVFSILRSKNTGLKYNTASMLEIESGSNDPCSYMLTVIMLTIMKGETSISSVLYMIFTQFFFGIVIGFGTAFLAKVILHKIKFDTPGFDMAFVIGAALLSYSLPALFNGNGYLSVYITGIILGNTKIYNKKSLVHFFDGVTGLMQMLIFFLLGLLATPSRLPDIFLISLGIFLFLTFAARPISVFSILSIFKCRISQQILVSFAGLRGAASIVFAIMATVSSATQNTDVFHIIFCIVLFSIAFQGSLLLPFAEKLDMTDKNTDILKTFSDYSEEIDLDFITINISDNHSWVDMAIKDIVLPPDTLITLILRNGNKIIPNGDTVFEQGDTVVLSARLFRERINLSLIEKKIEHKSKWIGKTLTEVSDTTDIDGLVVMILRKDETVVPNGNTVILENDILVINSNS